MAFKLKQTFLEGGAPKVFTFDTYEEARDKMHELEEPSHFDIWEEV
tara:strand:+ start:758 stop:895 length:138 start_codon:yes stop_codon:yes gene_type:complete